MRRLTLVAILAVAGCGGGSPGPPPAELVARADRVCQEAAVPGIPGDNIGTNLRARLAQLTLGQERREVARLRAIDWNDLDDAVDHFDRALGHLDAFVRSRGRADRERARYARGIDRWRRAATNIGLDLCSRFGFAY